MRDGIAFFCCGGEFGFPGSKDWGKTCDYYDKSDSVTLRPPLFFMAFFQCHVKGNKLVQLDMNIFLKGFCNFSAMFHLFLNWKKKKRIWRVENVAQGVQSSNCHSTPRISCQEDRELHQMHHWSVHRQPLLDSTVMWERWKQSFVVSLLKGLNLFQCCSYVF